MTQTLILWAEDQAVATIEYDPLADLWTLRYAPSWQTAPGAYPLSPALPLVEPQRGYAPGAVRRFVENLLPEGRALDISATTYGLAKSNIFGLIHALGLETAGAFRFCPATAAPGAASGSAQREIPRAELAQRLEERDRVPFVLWDQRVRTSLAGYQDKLLVYLDAPLAEGGRMYLAEPPLASTHILKPQPTRPDMPHLVINEHYCMRLAAAMGLPVAAVEILRMPLPVLVVTRFDRQVVPTPTGVRVHRKHIIDACQAADLPLSFKYERHLGSAELVAHYRDGMSFERLFSRCEQAVFSAATRLTLLRWALFQFLIGNCDAHGKNFSFFVQAAGLTPTPWYDLVSVVQYPGVSHELAMAFGDVFELAQVKSFALADFAQRCGIPPSLLKREATRLAKLAQAQAPRLVHDAQYLEDEQAFAQQISAFVVAQAERLVPLAADAARIKPEFL